MPAISIGKKSNSYYTVLVLSRQEMREQLLCTSKAIAKCQYCTVRIGVAWVKILRGPNIDAARILVQGIFKKKFIKTFKNSI